LAGNTKVLGGGTGVAKVWKGNFTGTAKAELLVWYSGDQTYRLGQFTGTQINFTPAGNTKGFAGAEGVSPTWVGDFSGDGHDELLFWFPGDKNYWLGRFTGTQINYTLAGNTAGFGGAEGVSPTWVGDFSGDGHDELLFWFPGDKNYWLGEFTATKINYTLAGNTAGFGGAEGVSPIWNGDFTGSAKDELLFWFPGDGNWWLGTFAGTKLGYGLAGNTGRSHKSRIRLHLKVLSTPSGFTLTQALEAMRQVFSPAGIRVDLGSVEGLNLPALADLPVTTTGTPGVGGTVTSQQTQLFANRNNVGPDDMVVYFVRSTNPSLNGVATFPPGQPGAIVTNIGTVWTLGHEVGHVLGLSHISGEHTGCPATNPLCCSTPNFTRLMTGCGTNGITATPNFVQSEMTTMDSSALTVTCLPTEV
jgi:hypothetical protein